MNNGFIYEAQQSLFNDKTSINRSIIGYRKNETRIQYINHKTASGIIRKHHYSKTIFNNVLEHFGFFINGHLMGVLQFGYMLNHKSCSKVVLGTTSINDYRELNRMFFYDDAPKNTASRAMSMCFKVLQKKGVKWVQSFADERCKKNGLVYQACNFKYFGFHYSTFYTYKNRVYHNIMFTHKKDVQPLERREGKGIEEIRKEAVKTDLRQFRYIYFIDKKWIEKCTLNQQPYPKHYKTT